MSDVARFVCVDWGTSRLRATLCEYADGDATVRQRLSGPGIKNVRDSVEKALFDVIASWVQDYGEIPILLAGAVGSNIGWRNTPYLSCPFAVDDLPLHCTEFTARGSDIVIIPGLECTNSFGEPDTMRGEELQILGWLREDETRLQRTHLVCLPGTHTKWVTLEGGRVKSFQSAVTGELYALISEHSILLAHNVERAVDASFEDEAFALGVNACRAARGSLSHTLFSVRSRILTRQLSTGAAASFLSGVLVTADVMGALELLGEFSETIALIGEPTLCAHFASVLETFGLSSEIADGNNAATRGFSVVYRDRLLRAQQRSVSA